MGTGVFIIVGAVVIAFFWIAKKKNIKLGRMLEFILPAEDPNKKIAKLDAQTKTEVTKGVVLKKLLESKKALAAAREKNKKLQEEIDQTESGGGASSSIPFFPTGRLHHGRRSNG